MDSSLPAQPNQSLIRGLNCLQAVIAARRPVGVRELARQLGTDHTRVTRMLRTLAYMGLVQQTANRKYVTGPAIHVLAAQSLQGSELMRCAAPVLRQLRTENLSVALGVLWGTHVCYLRYDPSAHMTDHDQPDAEGSLARALYSSVGRALLAEPNMEDALRNALAELESEAAAEMNKEFVRIRTQGYAAVTFESGQTTLGVTVGRPAVAAISYYGNIELGQYDALAGRLKQAAGTIADALHNQV